MKVDSFLVGSVMNANWTDVAISSALLAVVLLVLAARWRHLTFFAFDRATYGVAHAAG